MINSSYMKNSFFLKQKGAISGLMVVVILILAIALPLSVYLTQKNQESRSKAASESTTGICGASTGEYFSSKPGDGLCDGGVIIWTDEKADDGDWNWTCKGDPNVADSSVDCIAIKQ
jgi:hypothetical protein